MSSDVIKHMAAKILSAIKEQNVEYYKDTARKEQLVRIILSKIEKYSDKINNQNMNKITSIITREITQEYHPDRKTRVSYPQKQSSDFFEPFNNSMSSLQFERNNIDTLTKGRGTVMSNRPLSSSLSSSSKMNRQQSSTFRDNFMPIQNGYQQQHQQKDPNQYMDGTKEDVSKNYEKLLAERQMSFNGQNQRPETPDFSLDGSGKKKKEQNNQNNQQYQQSQYQQQHQQQHQQQYQPQHQQQNQQSQKNNFTHNPQTDYGIIGLNELPQNNTGFSSFDDIEEDFTNINAMNTGINMDKNDYRFNDNESVENRLKQLESLRGNLNVNYSNNSSTQQQSQILQSQIPQLPPPMKTSIRERERDRDIDNELDKLNKSNSSGDIYSMVFDQINNQHKVPIPIHQTVQQPVQQPYTNQMLFQLMEQQKKFQDEYSKMKEDNDELEQYKMVNSKLQERIIELQKQMQLQVQMQVQNGDNEKIDKLVKVKEETISQIQQLKKTQEEITKKLEQNNKLEETIKKMISNNINKFENMEDNIYISNEFNYQLLNPITSVTSLEIKNVEFPWEKNNIISTNNQLIFQFSNSINEPSKTNADDSDNEGENENESYYNYKYNQSNKQLIVNLIYGLYDIDSLVNILNSVLNLYKIVMGYNDKTRIVSFKTESKNKFSLISSENSLFGNLGFNDFNKYINKSTHLASKAYDLKLDKYVNIYIKNLNSSVTPVMQYILNQNVLNQSKKIIFKTVISELRELQFRFTDSKNREYHDIDFSIHIIIKHIHNESENSKIEHDLVDISSEDTYSIVKSSLFG